MAAKWLVWVRGIPHRKRYPEEGGPIFQAFQIGLVTPLVVCENQPEAQAVVKALSLDSWTRTYCEPRMLETLCVDSLAECTQPQVALLTDATVRLCNDPPHGGEPCALETVVRRARELLALIRQTDAAGAWSDKAPAADDKSRQETPRRRSNHGPRLSPEIHGNSGRGGAEEQARG